MYSNKTLAILNMYYNFSAEDLWPWPIEIPVSKPTVKKVSTVVSNGLWVRMIAYLYTSLEKEFERFD